MKKTLLLTISLILIFQITNSTDKFCKDSKDRFQTCPYSLIPTTSANFSDIPENYPYQEAINYAKENSIVNGYSDGTFRPENEISREEFTKIIIGSNFEDSEIYWENCFSDVKWWEFEKYICTAKREGIIGWYDDGTFRPKNKISFLESAKIIVLADEFWAWVEDIDYIESDGINIFWEGLWEKKAIPFSIRTVDSKIKRGEMVEIIWRLEEGIENKKSRVFFNKRFLYHVKDGIVYYEWDVIEWADAKSFEVLYESDKWGCAKDKDYIYFNWRKINKWIVSDLETLEVLDEHYLKDKNNIYTYDNRFSFVSNDVENFQVIFKWYGKDKDYVYDNGRKIEWADPSTFVFLRYGYFNSYSKDKNNVYRSGYVLKWADPDTFEIMEKDYSKDKNFVYDDGEKIEWADPSTFEIINEDYSKDKNFVYYNRKKIEWSNPKTFQILDDDYLKDKNNVYYKGYREIIKIEWVDLKTFQILNYRYSKDKKHVYSLGNKIEWADSETFKLLDDGYSKDKNNFYYNGEIVDWIENTSSFEVLNKHYSKDENHVYYDGEKIEWADSKTFQFLKDTWWKTTSYAKDKNHIYNWRGKIEMEWIDSETFSFISELDDNVTYFRDKNNVYYSSDRVEFAKIEWADPNTFERIDFRFFYTKDKNYKYCLKYNDHMGWSIFRLNWVEFWEWEDLGWLYYKDSKSVYYNCSELEIDWIDAESFEIMEYNYSKDKNNVYYRPYDCDWWDCIKKVELGDPETFRTIEKWWNKYWLDKNGTYSWGEKISWADYSTIESLEWMFFKDKSSIYYTCFDYPTVKVKWADLESFQVLDIGQEWYVKDKNNVYYFDCNNILVIMWVDSETFKTLGNGFGRFSGYWKDKNNWYYNKNIMKWVDIETFEWLDCWYAKDKNRAYQSWKEIQLEKWKKLETFRPFCW